MCCVEHFSNCCIAGFAEGFWFSFDHWLRIPWFFFQGVGRGWSFLSFWPIIFFFSPWAVIRDTFISCSWQGFICLFLVRWTLVDIRLVNTHTHIYIYIYIHTHTHTHTHIYIYIYVYMLYRHIHIKIYAEHNQQEWPTSMNEQTHFLIKIYLARFILQRVMFLVCERRVGDGDRLLFWPKVLLATIAALLPHLWPGVDQLWVTEGPRPSVCKLILSLASYTNSPDHSFRAWRHSHSSPISYLGFIMTIVIVISSARQRRL